MTPAEIVMGPSLGLRALWIAAASAVILAAVWIFQGLGYAPCELCLTQRYAFYAAVPIALLTAFASRSAPGLARAGFALLALVFVASTVLAAYHVGVEQHWWPGPTACTGGPGSLDVNDLVKALEFGQGRALRRSAAQDRRIVARQLECRSERDSRGLCGARRAALGSGRNGKVRLRPAPERLRLRRGRSGRPVLLLGIQLRHQPGRLCGWRQGASRLEPITFPCTLVDIPLQRHGIGVSCKIRAQDGGCPNQSAGSRKRVAQV